MAYNFLTVAVRSAAFAALLTGSSAALAQTPNDVAHLLWGQNQPAFATSASPASVAPASGFTAYDIARLTAPQGAKFGTSAPTSEFALVHSAGGPADLARLTGSLPQVSGHAVTVAELAGR